MKQLFIFTAIVTSLFIPNADLFAMAKPTEEHAANKTITPSIHLVEEAAQALSLAAKSGVYNATVLHIDNSDDLWPSPTDEQINEAKTLLQNKDYQTLETAGRALTPGIDRLFSYINHLVMAHRLGIIKEVYWAVPSLEAFDLSQLQTIMSYPVNRSAPFASNNGTDLKITMPKITGTISGVPVTIGLLRHFKQTGEPLWVDIELDYFTELYKNPVSSSYLSLLSGFVAAHQKLELSPALTTITYGNLDGQLAIGNRYLGKWLHTMLSNPKVIDEKPPVPWVSKNEALYQHFFMQYDNAITEYGLILQKNANDSDAHFSLGMLLLDTEQLDQALLSLERARTLDPAYIIGFIDAKQRLSSSTKVEYKKKIDQVLQEQSFVSHLPLRVLAADKQEAGDHLQTIALLKNVINAGDDSPLVMAMMGESFEQTGQLSLAIKAYQTAIKLNRNVQQQMYIPKLWINLGKALEKADQETKATGVYQEYLQLFPNDSQENIEDINGRLKRLETKEKE